MLIRLLSLCCFLLPAAGAVAARLEIPLRIPLEAIGQALDAHLAPSASGARTVYREGRCRYLKLANPRLAALDGRLRFVGDGAAAFGVELMGNCQNAAFWRGELQLMLVPTLDRAGRLRMRIVDSKLAAGAGRNASAAGAIWDLSKRQVHARLQRFSFDLEAIRSALLDIVRSAAPPEHAAELEAALTQLQILQPRVEPSAIVVPIALEIPDAWLTAPTAAVSTAPLTEAELDALDQAVQPWDAFLLYSIKQLALDNEDGEVRKRLLALLLDSRHQLAAMLAGETRAAGDPVRALFIDAWGEMRTILAAARYALFLDAGDALLALDSAAPGLGMRLSTDGLRQLARSLRPGAAGDPLAYDWAVDPQLGALFGIEDIPKAEPVPPQRSWLELFIRSAHAATQGRALDRWIPTRAELRAYEAQIGALLSKTAAAERRRVTLPGPYDRIYQHLVPATALIESCWRQYELRAGEVRYLRSAASSVGIMQINERVWRGFYDIQRLRWDIAYNVHAGAQILMRYVKDYAIPYAERSGNLDDVPRAAYAVYNAGPRGVGRFNKVPRHPREERVDERLWTLFQGIATGGQADLNTCAVTTAAAAR
jgi:hypothetical protein